MGKEVTKQNFEQFVDEAAHNRVCLYLSSCVPYVPDPENINLLKTALSIFRKFNQWPQALRLALQINDHTLIEEVFLACKDRYPLTSIRTQNIMNRLIFSLIFAIEILKEILLLYLLILQDFELFYFFKKFPE